jgi:hypothetical protein
LNLFPSSSLSPHLAPSDLHLFGPLKDAVLRTMTSSNTV